MPLCRSLDHRASGGVDALTGQQEKFKMLFTFFERMVAVGNCTRVALQYGHLATGTGYWDEANPFGANAFAVYWFGGASKPFAVLIQLGWQAASKYFGLTPGNPGALNGVATLAYGVGVALAARADGTNPWAGTVLNDGTDTKGTPVWSAGGSTLFVVDRACASGGSFATNVENCIRFGVSNALAASAGRVHAVGNANGFALFVDYNGTGYYGGFVYGGVYNPRPGLVASHTLPLVLIGHSGGAVGVLPTNTSQTYGLAAGTGAYEGGIIGRPADGVRALAPIETFTDLLVALAQPNEQPATAELDIAPIGLFVKDALRYGYVGTMDAELVGVVTDVANLQTDAAAATAYLAHPVIAEKKYAIPWDGGAAPGTGTTRVGRQS